jgi:methionyl-tRNA formyltransferase
LETAGELHDRLAVDGAALVTRVVADLSAGTAVETPQDHSRATLAPKLSREISKVDWTRPAAEIARKIRGLHPWPGCRAKLSDAAGEAIDSVRLVRARAVIGSDDEGGRWQPGEVTSVGAVQAGDGLVEVVELQPDGKRPMSLADYKRGHRWCAGLRLVSMD